MPGVTLAAFIATVLPAGRYGLNHLALGVTLLGLYWIVEWRGIGGTFEGRVPRRPLGMLRRALWLAGLVICVADALWFHHHTRQDPRTALDIIGVSTTL